MRKTRSMLRYFKAHFSDPYPAPFLWLVAVLLWAQFGLKAGLTYLARPFRTGRAAVGAAVKERVAVSR
jgi:hypothetical protein